MRKVFDIALKSFLVLSPIFLFKNYLPSFARAMFFIVGTFALFGLSLSLKPERKLSNVWLSVIFILGLIRVFFGNGIETINEWYNFWLSFAGFIYLFTGILLFYVVFTYASNPKNYLKPLIAVCILNFILTTCQIFGYDFLWVGKNPFSNICGFMEISAQLGQYSAMSLPVLMYINPFLAVIPLATLIASKSITPIVSLLVGASFLQLIRYRIALIIFAIIAIFLAVNIKYVKAKFHTRPIMWGKTITAILKKPYLGGGYRSFNEEVIYKDLKGNAGMKDYSRAHSDYMHTAQEAGIPIVIAIGMFIGGLVKKFLRANKDRLTYFLGASVCIALVNMAGQCFIRYASVAGTFVVLLAFLCIKLESGCYDEASNL